MKKYLFIIQLFLLLAVNISFTQQLSPQVVATSGDFYSGPSGMLSFTTGEMAAVETYAWASFILTQGFQQPWDFGTAVKESPGTDFSFGIYPNPSDGNFSLLTESDKSAKIEVEISDVLGRKLFHTRFYHEKDVHVEMFDLSKANQGMYLISIIIREINSLNPEYHFVRKIQIIK